MSFHFHTSLSTLAAMAARALVAIFAGDGSKIFINDMALAWSFLEMLGTPMKDMGKLMKEVETKKNPHMEKDGKQTAFAVSAERCGGGVSVETPPTNTLAKPVFTPAKMETNLKHITTELCTVSAERCGGGVVDTAQLANANANTEVKPAEKKTDYAHTTTEPVSVSAERCGGGLLTDTTLLENSTPGVESSAEELVATMVVTNDKEKRMIALKTELDELRSKFWDPAVISSLQLPEFVEMERKRLLLCTELLSLENGQE